LQEAVRRVRERAPGQPFEIEADTPEQAEQAVKLGAAWVLLDNWTPRQLAEHAPRLRKLGAAKLEASGGIAPGDVSAFAPWVDRISLGALTHSARAVPFSLEILRP
jgi:nicotinate-nucleotide pyrophosphorylase (carboxylating)